MKFVRMFVTCCVVGLGVALAVAAPAQAYPAGQIGTAQINKTLFAPGETVVVTVEHTTPGPLTMTIFSAPVTIGTGTVGVDGNGSVSGAIPAGYSGAHTIQVTGAGGEIYPFAITVTGSPGISCGGLAHTGPPDAQNDRHTVQYFGRICTGPVGASVTCTLTLAPWSAAKTEVIGASGSVGFGGPFTDAVHLLPVGESNVEVSFTDAQGAVVGVDNQYILVVTTTSVPSTTPPVPPTGASSSAAATVTAVGSGTGGGDLASTGTQAGLGVGVGLAALLAGGLVLVVSRRRRPARHGG